MKIEEICQGVYWNEDGAGPREIVHDGLTLVRFMDHFYLTCSAEDLSPNQVTELCRKRQSRPEIISNTNSGVRQLIRKLIDHKKPESLLEIGSGSNPILTNEEHIKLGIDYVRADADPTHASNEQDFSGQNPGLRFENSSFEMAIAIFVLHFRFYTNQIDELYRCLKLSGIFIANVYSRSPESRIKLIETFKTAGFLLTQVLDSQRLCKDHEYWVIGKQLEYVDETSKLLQKLMKS